MLSFEHQAKTQGYSIIIGIDEAGRGPLAGPVVASAVVLKDPHFNSVIRDSKKMTKVQRERAFDEIFKKAHVGIGLVDAKAIDRINILEATFLAMTEAVNDLLAKIPGLNPEDTRLVDQVCLLVDGNRFKTTLPFSFKTIIKGDSLSLSIACASVVAKVTRDRLMDDYHKIYPQYGFAQHKGYPTVAHKQKIAEHGFSLIHRKTFNATI